MGWGGLKRVWRGLQMCCLYDKALGRTFSADLNGAKQCALGPASHTWYHSQGPDVVACWVSFQITARRARRSKKNWLSGRTKDGGWGSGEKVDLDDSHRDFELCPCTERGWWGNWAEKWHYLMVIWVAVEACCLPTWRKGVCWHRGRIRERRGEKSGRLHPMALHVAEQRPGSQLEWGQRTEDRISNVGEQEAGGTREMQEEDESVWSWTLCWHRKGLVPWNLVPQKSLRLQAAACAAFHLQPWCGWGSLQTGATSEFTRNNKVLNWWLHMRR